MCRISKKTKNESSNFLREKLGVGGGVKREESHIIKRCMIDKVKHI